VPLLPDLATETPLWLALLTVGVNAVVGALRATVDDERHWDIVGVVAALGAHYSAQRLGLRTRRVRGAKSLLLTRTDRRPSGG